MSAGKREKQCGVMETKVGECLHETGVRSVKAEKEEEKKKEKAKSDGFSNGAFFSDI